MVEGAREGQNPRGQEAQVTSRSRREEARPLPGSEPVTRHSSLPLLPPLGIARRCQRRIIGINGDDIIFAAGRIGRIIKVRRPGPQTPVLAFFVLFAV